MKFYGPPNMLVKAKKRKKLSTEFEMKPIFRFNENGEYETSDEKLIQKLKKKFKHEETKKYTCKQCGDEFENKGLYLAHMKGHKKEG
jgi:rubrerythrin